MNKIIILIVLCILLYFIIVNTESKFSNTAYKTKIDTLIMPIRIPNDTIIFYKSKNKIVNIPVEDTTKINLLLDSISVLYAKLKELEIKQIAILDTIFPNSKDTLYIEFDKVTDVFAPIYLKRSVYKIPVEVKTIYIPVEKENHSIFVDVGIGLGAFGLGYIVGR